MTIRLHIDRLVLEGIALAPHQQPYLRAALEGELSRLLAVGGLAPGLVQEGNRARAAGSPIQLAQENSPGDLGQQIARSVYGGLGS